MSIWRSIDCPMCGGESFDVADNGVDSDVRIGCDKCNYEMILSKRQIRKRKKVVK